MFLHKGEFAACAIGQSGPSVGVGLARPCDRVPWFSALAVGELAMA